MKNIHIITTFFCLFLLVFGCTAQKSPQIEQKEQPVQNMTTTQDKEVETMKLPNTYANEFFSIGYPSSWKYVEDAYETSTEIILVPLETEGIIGFTTTIYSEKSIPELENSIMKSIENSQGTNTLISRKEMTFAGQPAIEIIRKVNSVAFKGEQADYIISKNAKVFQFTSVKPNDATEKEKEELGQVVKSFEFK